MSNPDGTLLGVDDLTVHFPLDRHEVIHAVDGVSFEVSQGETLGLVGESGSGKSTIGLTIVQQHEPVAGRLVFQGEDVTGATGGRLRALRREVQMIFQDPYSSLNPRMKVGELVSEPLIVHGLANRGPALRARIGDLLERCGLPRSVIDHYPTAFSGGERQRIAIARALAPGPKLIVADEAVSALDVSIQAQIINLMRDLQEEDGLSFLFISHDLAIVRHLAQRLLILYAGRVMESGDTGAIFAGSAHPYTQALLSAAPIADYEQERKRRRIVLSGEVPSSTAPPPGCRFNTRCPLVIDRCRVEQPPLEEVAPGHRSACWRADEAAALSQALIPT